MTLARTALWPETASTIGEQIDLLFIVITSICTAVGLLVAFLLVYFCVRYRRSCQSVPPPLTQQSHALEWFWTLTPLVIFLGMFFFGGLVYLRAFRPPEDARTVYAVGKQWMWKFQHPDGQREIDRLHVPVGRPVELVMISQDVIHSFFVPEFRLHMDLLPGRYTSVWFEATEPGVYDLFCSEYCGTGHSQMRGKVVAMEPTQFQQWLEEGAEGSMAQQGRGLFYKYRCISCHSARWDARAPVLENLYGEPVPLDDGRVVVADEDYLRRSMLDPTADVAAGFQPIMPTFEGELSEEEIIRLIAFIRSLQHDETPPPVSDFPPPEVAPEVAPETESGISPEVPQLNPTAEQGARD